MSDPIEKPKRSTLPTSEVFYSIEGEGPLTGYPTMFIRAFGCNFTCQGFNNPTNEEPQVVHLEKLDDFQPSYGCDSIYSWHPAYKHLVTKLNGDELWEKVIQTLPKRGQDMMLDHDEEGPLFSFPAISITGGEPMLHQRFWTEFFRMEASRNFIRKLIIETNGSVPVHPEFAKSLSWLENRGCLIVWSNSPKLSNSGEKRERAIRPHIIRQQQQRLKLPVQYFKFVSNGSVESFEEIVATVKEYNKHLLEVAGDLIKPEQVYVMPEGATREQQEQVQTKVSDMCLEYGYNLCARVHCWVYNNAIGT